MFSQDTLQHSESSLTNSSTDTVAHSTAAPFRFSDVETRDTTEDVIAPPARLELFTTHLLKPHSRSAEPFNAFTMDWFTITLLGMLVLLTWFKVFYYRIFSQLWDAFFSLTTTNQIVRDESVLLQRASLILSIIAYFVSGLFLYQVSAVMGWSHHLLPAGFNRFILFALIIALSYSIKMIALRFLSIVFGIEKPVATYIFNIFLVNMVIGLLLIPAIILVAYLPMSLRHFIVITTLTILGLIFIYRLVRAVGIGLSIQRFSIFYLFLYICSFEIAPLLIIYKVATL